MVKARGKVTRSQTPKNVAGMAFLRVEQWQIAAWTPRPDGQPPLEQVHILLHVEGFPIPLVMRFKGPDTLGFLIEELAKYRYQVWPGAEPVNLQAKFDDDPPKETNP